MPKTNNLSKLKKALGIKKKYRVIMTQTEDFEITVEAKDEPEAIQLAHGEFSEGNYVACGDSDVSTTSCEDITNEEL